MTQIEVIYDSSKDASHQFYNSLTKQFISYSEAQQLSDEGSCKIVIGCVPSPPSIILYDPISTYWECYYDTDPDKFLCETDAHTLANIGLGEIVEGEIPHVITKEGGVYFDVVKNRRIGEESALKLVTSGEAVLKNKDIAESSSKNKVDSETTVTTESTDTCEMKTNSTTDTAGSSVADKADLTESVDEFKDAAESLPAHPTKVKPTRVPQQQQQQQRETPTSSSLKQKSMPSTSMKQEKKEESFLAKVAPIAAGAAVAGVAIAGVAAAMFFGSGSGKKGKGRK